MDCFTTPPPVGATVPTVPDVPNDGGVNVDVEGRLETSGVVLVGSEIPPPPPSPTVPNGFTELAEEVTAWAPPSSRFRLPPPASTPIPMSPTVISDARLQSAFNSASTNAWRSGCTVGRLVPMTSCPRALLSMPMVSGEITTVPSGNVLWAGHWILKPSGAPTVLITLSSVCGDVVAGSGTLTPATLSDPMLNVPVDTVAPPDSCVAAQCRPPSTIAPLPIEMAPTSDVASATRVFPLSIDVCELEVSPDTVIKPPGT